MSVGAELLAEIAAREGEIGLQHARHLVDVLLHRLDFRRCLLDQREFELEAREHGAQVVRDAGQHGGALLDRALDARLHLDEGLRRAPHLARAARAEIRHVAALAEAFGGVGEPQDRLDLVAQEDDGDAEQHQRGADHPEQEDFRIRRIGRAAAREHPHHRVVELDADLDQRRLADGVDPVRPADLLAQFLRQRLIQQREERLRTRRRHLAEGQEIDHQAEPLLRDAADLRLVGILRIAAVDVDQRGDVLHHAGRQPLGDDVPVPLHEHEGDHRLQDHHRHDDDEQRARVEALRHHAVEPAAEPPPAVGNAAERGVDAAHRRDRVVPVPGFARAARSAVRMVRMPMSRLVMC